jgi:cytochrome c oxidase assembly protein subunit 16
MPVFASKKFTPTSQGSSFPARYRAALAKHPFVLFGLPFLATMVLGSFFLTPATALRFERHDRKTRQLTREEEMGILGKEKRKFDMREEYYVSLPTVVLDIKWHAFANERDSDWHTKI